MERYSCAATTYPFLSSLRPIFFDGFSSWMSASMEPKSLSSAAREARLVLDLLTIFSKFSNFIVQSGLSITDIC